MEKRLLRIKITLPEPKIVGIDAEKALQEYKEKSAEMIIANLKKEYSIFKLPQERTKEEQVDDRIIKTEISFNFAQAEYVRITFEKEKIASWFFKNFNQEKENLEKIFSRPVALYFPPFVKMDGSVPIDFLQGPDFSFLHDFDINVADFFPKKVSEQNGVH
jgi:hypothetical protein